MKKKFPYIAQYDTMDCGPACLRMIAKYYGQDISFSYIRRHCYLSREGVSLLGISVAAEKIGMNTCSFKETIENLIDENSTPCILYWRKSHFVVLYAIKKKCKQTLFYIADPAQGKIKLTEDEFKDC